MPFVSVLLFLHPLFPFVFFLQISEAEQKDPNELVGKCAQTEHKHNGT